MSSRMNERNAVVGAINPATHAAGTVDSAAIDLKNLRRVMFVVMCGNLSGGGLVDFKIQSSTDSGGSYSDVAGLAITQMNNANGTNCQAIVEVTADQLADGQRYVRGRLTVTTAASPVAVLALGGDTRIHPVASIDASSVTQIVD